jgi:hypothetical protein
MQCHSSLRCGNCGLAIVHTSALPPAATPSTQLFDKMREIAASTGNTAYSIPITDPCYNRLWNRPLEWSGEIERTYINDYFNPQGWNRVYTLDRNREYQYYFMQTTSHLYCKLTVRGQFREPTEIITVEKAYADRVDNMIRNEPKNSFDRVIKHDIEDPVYGEPRDY